MTDRLALVRLRPGMKPHHYFLPSSVEVAVKDWVVVQVEEEEDCAVLESIDPHGLAEWEEDDLPRVLGPASEEEVSATLAGRQEKEEGAIAKAYEKVRAHNLEMKLVTVQYYHRNNKVKFYFTSESRVDFRELVKDLAHVFHARIEMRQIGVRDAAGMVGGFGLCGEELCCSRFLHSFDPITIKMAKDQHLALNPSKISGCCGRLLCCLKYEHEVYCHAQRNFPRNGTAARYNNQDMKVVGFNLIKQTVSLLQSGQVLDVPWEEFQSQNPNWKKAPRYSDMIAQREQEASRSHQGDDLAAVSEEESATLEQLAKTDEGTEKPRRPRKKRRRSSNRDNAGD